MTNREPERTAGRENAGRLRERMKKIAEFFRRLSADKNFDIWRKLGGFCLLAYLIDLALTLLFPTTVSKWSFGAGLLMFFSLPIYSLAYTAPGAVLTLLAAGVLAKSRRAQPIAAGIVGALCFAATQLLLLADFGLLKNFGYHFNSFVWNLLTTPGGFASMGVRSNTILPLSGLIAAVTVLNFALMYFMIFFRGGAAALRLYRVFKTWRKFALIAAAAVFGFAAATVFAWDFYMKYPEPLRASKCIPAFRRVTMNEFFDGLGFREPTRDELMMRIPFNIENYPQHPIRRRASRRKYNVVWLVCESWRADMLDAEVMPETWKFSEKYGIRFTKNYSGGNNTRMGIFSMFYGLYGSYWFPFLDLHRGPLFMDWIIDDGYDVKCVTSAKFSYPEFDQTVFARIPSKDLHSDDDGPTYERDVRNTEVLLDFIRRNRGDRPFLAFMFFESPHYPFEFPDKNAVFKPFVDKVDYMQLGPGRAAEIKNRYRNCCRTLDEFLGQVFAALEEKKLLDDTIVVIVGDHGEEFFEHGHQGHGQNFFDVQTRTPLVIALPGERPRVYDGMSSHLDIVAILAPYFGVENPAEDFSHGMNLLAPNAPKRRYTVIAQFDDSFFTAEKYKMPLPLDEFGAITARAYDAEDREVPDPGAVYREYQQELMQVLRDLNRFIK